jgi:hypothetical protein
MSLVPVLPAAAFEPRPFLQPFGCVRNDGSRQIPIRIKRRPDRGLPLAVSKFCRVMQSCPVWLGEPHQHGQAGGRAREDFVGPKKVELKFP